jgi:hypothetical protein
MENHYNYPDYYAAKSKIMQKYSTHGSGFFSTLWKGEVILFEFDYYTKNITNIFSSKEYYDDEIEALERVTKDFIS